MLSSCPPPLLPPRPHSLKMLKVLPFTRSSRSDYGFACFNHCQEFGVFSFQPSSPLSSLTCRTVNSIVFWSPAELSLASMWSSWLTGSFCVFFVNIGEGGVSWECFWLGVKYEEPFWACFWTSPMINGLSLQLFDLHWKWVLSYAKGWLQ